MRLRSAVASTSTALCLALIVAACSSTPSEPPAPAAPEPLTLPSDAANYAPHPLVGPIAIPPEDRKSVV